MIVIALFICYQLVERVVVYGCEDATHNFIESEASFSIEISTQCKSVILRSFAKKNHCKEKKKKCRFGRGHCFLKIMTGVIHEDR